MLNRHRPMNWHSHFVRGVIVGYPEHQEGWSEEMLDRWAVWFLSLIEYRKLNPIKPGEEGYEFWKHYQ